MPPRIVCETPHSPLHLRDPTPDMWYRPFHHDLQKWFKWMGGCESLDKRYHTWTQWMGLPFVTFPLQFTGHHMRLLPPYPFA